MSINSIEDILYGSLKRMDVKLKFEKEKFESELEERMSRHFTPSQIKLVKNLLIDCLEEKLYMSSSEPEYLKMQEFCRGQISILQYLLASHQELVVQEAAGSGQEDLAFGRASSLPNTSF